MVPHSWISECLEMIGVANNVQDFLHNSMESWKLELNASGEKLGEADIRRGIFQGDSLSPLLFILCMVSVTWLLRRAKACYEWGDKEFMQFGIVEKCGVLSCREIASWARREIH